MRPSSRWWDDVEKAQQILSIVGGDDVAQSVGTVALGYHALLAGKLRPLADSTLVDFQDVANALEEVDLVPVTKAMSQAVSPVLGSAADPYAVDLVAQLHEEARDGIRHELQVLTAKGVSWPQAVERICGVAGVPARAVNGYVQKMAQPQVNPRVLADEGDRTLMTWASRLGKREATPVLEGVAKDDPDFDEREHPRGPDGRFVDAPDAGEAEVDPRKARLSRIGRISRIAGLQDQQRQQQAEAARRQQQAEERKRGEKKSLADLQAEVLGRPSARAQVGRAQMGRAQMSRAQQERTQASRAQASRAQRSSQELAVREGATKPTGRAEGAYVPQLQEKAVLDIDPGDVRFTERGDIISATELGRIGDVTTQPGDLATGKTRLEINQAYVEHDNGDGTFTLHPDYDYMVGAPTLGGPEGLDLVVPLIPVDRGDVDKADPDFDESEHPRGEDGRFIDADSRQARLSRISRISRIGRASSQAQQAAQQAREREEQERSRATSAALGRLQQTGRTQAGRAQATRAQAGRTQAQRPQAQRRTQVAQETKDQADISLAEQHALLLDESTFAQLTDTYVDDEALSSGVWLSGLTGQSPTEIKGLMKPVQMMRGDQVAPALAQSAWQSIQQQPSAERELPIAEDYHVFTTAEEAREFAVQVLGAHERLNENLEAYVPGFQPVGNPAGGDALYRPAVFRQPLRDNPNLRDEPKHVVTGESDAIIALRNGQTEGLVLRRVAEQVDTEKLERMGGGTPRTMANAHLNTNVFEVLFASQDRKRRA